MPACRSGGVNASVLARLCLLACAVLGSGCAPPLARSGAAQRSPRFDTTPARAPYFRYHPTQTAQIFASHALGEETTLYAGARGERFVVEEDEAYASFELAPENLVGIAHADAWYFLGEHGTFYVAKTALGQFVRSAAPPSRLVRARLAGAFALGISSSLELLRSDNFGATWHPVGPAAERFMALEVFDAKRAAALATPEALYFTHDAGVTWTRAHLPAIGAFDLAKVGDRVCVGNPLHQQCLDPGLEQYTKPSAPRLGLDDAAQPRPQGPNAGAIDEGRAFISADDYVEAVLEKDKVWIRRGAFSENLQKHYQPEMRDCNALRLSGAGQFAYLVCVKNPRALEASFEFFSSTDGARSFRREPFSAKGPLSLLKIAANAYGDVLLSGICPHLEQAAGCVPSGVHLREFSANGSAPRWRELHTPGARGTALGLSFAPAGDRAYALLRRANGSVVLHTARDKSGFSPDTHPLTPEARGGEYDESEPRYFRVLSLSSSSSGYVTLLTKQRQNQDISIFDRDGHWLQTSGVKQEATNVGAAGLFAYAFSANGPESWESNNGGLTWHNVPTPHLRLCPGDPDCSIPIACAEVGCVIGDELSRVGFAAGPTKPRAILPPPAPSRPALTGQASPAGLTCTLDSSPWQKLPLALSLPNVSSFAVGSAAWFLAARDPTQGSAAVYYANLADPTRLQNETLFTPVANASRYALRVEHQAEGIAALRYKIPEKLTDAAFYQEIEIAARNFYESHALHQTLDKRIDYLAPDFISTDGKVRLAQPHLLSISGPGVYLALHHGPAEQDTYFVAAGVRSPIAPLPSRIVGPSRNNEFVRLANTDVPLRLLAQNAVVSWGYRDDQSWQLAAHAIGVPEADQLGFKQSIEIAFLRGQPGISRFLEGTPSYFYLLQNGAEALAPALRVPDQDSFSDPPPACPLQTPARTRFAAPPTRVSRRSVTIEAQLENPRILKTEYAVVSGSENAPCLYGWEARPATQSPLESLLIFAAALDKSAYFRLVRDDATGNGRVEFHPVSCRYAAKPH